MKKEIYKKGKEKRLLSAKSIPKKPNKKQLKIIKEGWKQFRKDYDTFMGLVFATEKWMRKETGIDSLEFIHDSMCMGWIGVGTYPPDMKLLHGEYLWEEKK